MSRKRWMLVGVAAVIGSIGVVLLDWAFTPRWGHVLMLQNNAGVPIEVVVFDDVVYYPYEGDKSLTILPGEDVTVDMGMYAEGGPVVWAFESTASGRREVRMSGVEEVAARREIRHVYRFMRGRIGSAVGTHERFIDGQREFGSMEERIAGLEREEAMFLAEFIGPDGLPRVHSIVTDGGMATHLRRLQLVVQSGDTFGGSLNVAPAELNPALLQEPLWGAVVRRIEEAGHSLR